MPLDLQAGAPDFTPDAASRLLADHFGLTGSVEPLPSYIDQNFRVTDATGQRWVLKLTNALESREELAFQHRVLDVLAEREPGIAPVVRPSLTGETIARIVGRDGREHLARIVSYLPGRLLSAAPERDAVTWRSLGRLLGRIDRSLADLDHPAMDRPLRWDLAQAEWTEGRIREILDLGKRALVERAQVQFRADVVRRLDRLPHQVIYNDANDHNLVVADGPDPARITSPAPISDAARITGAFDFGDAIHTARIFELAVAGAYAVFRAPTPLDVLAELVAAYHEVTPLEPLELACLLPSVEMRLVVSVIVSHQDAAAAPDNEYIRVSESLAWTALEQLTALAPREVEARLRSVCGYPEHPELVRPTAGESILERRSRHLGPALSVSYRQPLHLVRGRMQYLFDADGRAYLDGVNNICHVGHCHPRVVRAACEQIETLNTNTRYLHEHVVRLAERLAALFPDPLEVCTFVNSGSEANELALRMARTHTGRHAVLCLGGGYHGNTTSLVDYVSSYKHDGPGGRGAPDWVYTVPCPDPVRGVHRGPDAAERYLDTVRAALALAESDGRPIAAFIAEPIIGCGGQVVPPAGYLAQAFELAREAGAVTIADEVQVGFGRTGSGWWGFAAQGAVPDLVTVGKPIGNGHPLAAVIAPRSIADSFDNGMEFFSSFGGNPVSCAIGLAVLDVLEEERLPEHAARVGDFLRRGFEELRVRHPIIADVRGMGLYLGIELLHPDSAGDRKMGDVGIEGAGIEGAGIEGAGIERPAADVVTRVLEIVRDSGVLLSYDGPYRNVIKIKPPLVIEENDATLLIAVLDRALSEAVGELEHVHSNVRLIRSAI